MTLMKLRKKMASRRIMQVILWALVAVFVASIALTGMYGGKNSGSGGGFASLFGNSSGKVIATVNGMKVKEGDFTRNYDTAVKELTSAPSIDDVTTYRQRAFAMAVQDVLKKHLLKQTRAGLGMMTGSDYAKEYAQKMVTEAHDSVAASQKAEKEKAKTPAEKAKLKTDADALSNYYDGMLKQMGGGESNPISKPIDDKKFSEWYINKFLLKKDADGIRDQFLEYIKMQRLGEAYVRTVQDPFTADFVKKLATEEVDARIIFIATKDNSLKSWQDAEKKANALHADLMKNPAGFAVKATKESSDTDTNGKGGSLGWITAGDNKVSGAIEFLAFITPKGKVSPVMPMFKQSYTGSKTGFFFVKTENTRKRAKVDESWKKHAEFAVTSLRQRYGPEFGSLYVDYQMAIADIQAKNEEMAAYLAEMRNDFKGASAHRKNAYNNDKSLLPIVRQAFALKLGDEARDFKEKVQYYIEAIPGAGTPSREANLFLQIGIAYAEMTPMDKLKAQEYLGKALAKAGAEDRNIREQLKYWYAKIGDTATVKVIDKWFIDNPAQESPYPGGMGMPDGMNMAP